MQQNDHWKTAEPKKASRELRRLVDEFLSDNLSRYDFVKLEELLEADQVNREYYIFASSVESLIPALSRSLEDTVEARPFRKKTKLKKLLAAAAAIGFLAGMVSLYAVRRDEVGFTAGRSETQDAILEDVIDVEWADGQHIFEIGQKIDREIEIESGAIQLVYRNGTTLIIEGPASFEVTGTNSGRLSSGSLVADVPSSGKGFTLEFGEERLVDHGTRFGVRLLREGASSEVAVFEGEIEIFLKDGKSTYMTKGHAARIRGSEIQSIPVEREHFLREFPSNEFGWKMPEAAQGTPAEMEFDVSPLVGGQGEYRCLFKWMRGEDQLLIDSVQLWCGDLLISEDCHKGSTGDLRHTLENIYTLYIDAPIPTRGAWKLKTKICTAPPSDGLPQIAESEGMMLFHSMPDLNLWEDSYTGKWDYWHDGVEWTRDFEADGTMTLYRMGEMLARGEWRYENSFLVAFFPATNVTERMYLRQRGRLVFVERPFSDARRSD